ncbi:MAG TPA: hypothetical protein PKW35_24295, partial [Nannocystaceae bacterium]|nr:hypothetical protein [Nannocystaceae bacterium]
RGLFGQAAATQAAAPATAEDGRLRLTSSPPGASVTIDGVLAGEATYGRAQSADRSTWRARMNRLYHLDARS